MFTFGSYCFTHRFISAPCVYILLLTFCALFTVTFLILPCPNGAPVFTGPLWINGRLPILQFPTPVEQELVQPVAMGHYKRIDAISENGDFRHVHLIREFVPKKDQALFFSINSIDGIQCPTLAIALYFFKLISFFSIVANFEWICKQNKPKKNFLLVDKIIANARTRQEKKSRRSKIMPTVSCNAGYSFQMFICFIFNVLLHFVFVQILPFSAAGLLFAVSRSFIRTFNRWYVTCC